MVCFLGIVVFDLEGVLIDNNLRLKKALRSVDPKAKEIKDLDREKRTKFWTIFMNHKLANQLDEVNELALEIWKDRMKKGHKLVILSGTKKEVVMSLINKLKMASKKMGFEFKPTMVIWRPRRDKRKSFVFKKQKIVEIERLLNDQIVEIHDDDPDTVNELKKYGYNAILWEDLKPKI